MSILSQQKQSQAPDFPNIRPSLDLRFALAKKLDPRITFTRGSTGTYFGPDGLMRTAGVNEPRFDHDPITGQSLGLLVEESRQNLLTYSSEFNTNWNKTNISIVANSITSPDGTTNAIKQIETTGKGLHRNNQSISKSAVATTYTFSIFAKVGERNGFEFGMLDSAGYVDCFPNLKNGTFTGVPTINGSFVLGSYGSVEYPNGWYRFYVTATTTAQTSVTAFYGTTLAPGSVNNYQGDGTSGIYIWGAQVEAGAFPTSYIPTTNATVTRTADTANISGTNFSNFFNASEGTLFVDSEMPYQTDSRFPAIGFSRSIGGSNNCIQFYYYNTSNPNVTFLVRNFADASGGGQSAANLIEWGGPYQTVGVYKKFGGTYKFGEFNYYFNGKLVSKVLSNKKLPSNLSFMDIGTLGTTSHRLNGHIRRITYYPIQITNQQLINLTS